MSDHRVRGVGTLLLGALLDSARAERLSALSLSVEKANPAVRLYRRFDFESVKDLGDAVTMQVRLRG